MKIRSMVGFAVSALMCSFGALASNYPTKPIRMIVPFAAGGTSDTIARVLSDKMSQQLNVPVVVENKAGAGGNIGSELVARSDPDGYTMLMGTVATHGINASLYKNIAFDPVKDFKPITLIASTPSVLLINPSVPATSVKQLIEYAKANPGKLNFGSSGNGSSHHLAGELFNAMAGTQMKHIPYRGTSAAQTDLVGGQIQVLFDTLPAAMPLLKGGKVKALAVSSAQRDPALPDLPTISEAGVKGYEVGSWYGLLFPANTPDEIVNRISTTVTDIIKTPEITTRLRDLGATPVASSPAQFASHIASEQAKWASVIKQAGARVD